MKCSRKCSFDKEPIPRKKSKDVNCTAIGTSSFKKLVKKSTVIVDKSLLIKEFIQHPAEILLITFPNNWGKSINMNMIKMFLEIEIDKNGESYPDKKQSKNYKLFTNQLNITYRKKRLLRPLKISNECEFVDEHLGKHPVIFVDLKDVFCNSYETIVRSVNFAISDAFRQHLYLFDKLYVVWINKKSTPQQKKEAEEKMAQFKKLTFLFGKETNSELTIQNGLKFLSGLLHEYFEKKVYIFIDEYDTPLSCIIDKTDFIENEQEKILDFLKKLMEVTFKCNEHLEKGFLTGEFNITRTRIFSDINNITECNFLNNGFAKYYGFTEADVDYLFNEYNLMGDLRDNAVDWYNGYKSYSDQNDNGKVYNPWSIVNCLHSKAIKNYWIDSRSWGCIKKFFEVKEIKEKLEKLLHDEDIEVQLQCLRFSEENFFYLNFFCNKADDLSINLFLSYLFASGYLTLSDNQRTSSLTTVKLPNKEIISELKDIFERNITSSDRNVMVEE